MTWWLGLLIIICALALGIFGGSRIGRLLSKNRVKTAPGKASTATNVAVSTTRVIKIERPPTPSPVTNSKPAIASKPPVQNPAPPKAEPVVRPVVKEKTLVAAGSIESKKEVIAPPGPLPLNTVEASKGAIPKESVLPAKAPPIQNVSETIAQLQAKIQQITAEEAKPEPRLTFNNHKIENGVPGKETDASTLERRKRFPYLIEIKTNLKIATTPWTGKPLSFKTRLWDTSSGEFDFLGADNSKELAQAYVDMALANYIVWVWTELGRSSDDMETSYKKLCTQITARLTQIIPEGDYPLP